MLYIQSIVRKCTVHWHCWKVLTSGAWNKCVFSFRSLNLIRWLRYNRFEADLKLLIYSLNNASIRSTLILRIHQSSCYSSNAWCTFICKIDKLNIVILNSEIAIYPLIKIPNAKPPIPATHQFRYWPGSITKFTNLRLFGAKQFFNHW